VVEFVEVIQWNDEVILDFKSQFYRNIILEYRAIQSKYWIMSGSHLWIRDDTFQVNSSEEKKVGKKRKADVRACMLYYAAYTKLLPLFIRP
jgi:hypothetical protein